LGNIVLLVAAVTWGLYSVLVKWATQVQSSLTVSLVAMVSGLLFVMPLVPFELARTPPGPLTVGIGLGVLYLGVVSTAVAMFLWTKALELLDAGVAGLTIFAQPVVGTLLGVLLLGERLSVGFFAGGSLILVGVVLVSLFESRRAPAQADAAS
jgi:drug/metabolite transporter (DMT)-like permease